MKIICQLLNIFNKQTKLCLLLFAIALDSLYGQNYTHEFGKYSNEEFQMTKYDREPNAEAVVIYDIGTSYFLLDDDGFKIVFERKTKTKVFNKAGLKWAQIEIPFYEETRDLEKISELKGNTYNAENGLVRKTELNTKNTYEEKQSEHWRVMKFAMPDVKEGSVFEVSYRITSPYIFNFRNWVLQSKIPIIYSEYITKMVPFYEYTYILQGKSKFDSFNSYEDKGLDHAYGGNSYHDMVYDFVMKNVPSFKDEGYITSVSDYILKLDFQLAAVHRLDGSTQQIMTTWPKLVKDILDQEEFGRFLKSSQKIAKTYIESSGLMLKTPKERAEVIDHYVKTNYNWNGNKDKFAAKSAKDFLKARTGNSSEINLYLTGLLNAAGLEAYPVLLSTRDHGKIKTDYPFHQFFNYVVAMVKIGNETFVLDATEPLCKFNMLPSRCFNDKGLVVKKDVTEWINFSSYITSMIDHEIDLKMDSKMDSVLCSISLNATGYEAVRLRNAYQNSSKDFKKELLSDNLSASDSIHVDNISQIDKPFLVSYKTKEGAEFVENKILISPFCDLPINENPFKQIFRTYPVDMVYEKGKSFVTTIHVPSNYKLLVKPETLRVKNNLVEINYQIEEIDRETLKVSGNYTFLKSVYPTTDYIDLKGYFNKIIDKFNEKIVLIKSN